MNRIDLKEKSKQDLGWELFKSPWLLAVGVVFVYEVITGAFSIDINTEKQGGVSVNIDGPMLIALLLALLSGIVVSILLLPLFYGFVKFFIKISRGEKAKFEHLFAGYKENWK